MLVDAYPALTPAVRDEARPGPARPRRLDAGPARRHRGGHGPARPARPRPEAGPRRPPRPRRSPSRAEDAAGARAAACPTPTARRSSTSSAPVVLAGGDPTRGKAVFEQLCAKCHMHSGEGGKVGPDLTGMAAHPTDELLVHILDPSRSVEGNFVQYTVATVDGRVLNGLLASETRTSIELIDAEGKSQTILREDIDELHRLEEVADARGVREAGDARAARRPARLPHASPASTCRSTSARRPPSSAPAGCSTTSRPEAERLVFDDWSTEDVRGRAVPARRPAGRPGPERGPALRPAGARSRPQMPRSVELPCQRPGEGDPPARRRRRLGVPVRRRRRRSR